MIISEIRRNNYIYINLHAEEVFTSNFLEDDCTGIFGDRLQIITLTRIIQYIKQQEGIELIVFDFNRIQACQPNLNRILIEFKTSGIKIILINIRKILCEEMALTSISNSKNIIYNDTFTRFYFFEDSEDPTTSIKFNEKLLFKEEFTNKIKVYIDTHKKPHTSSHVYLTSYVDIKRFISYEKSFLLFSLYQLAIKIDNEWNIELNKDPILICQSMNSSYIVSILSTLLKLDILILDKIGPINKLYNRVDNSISKERKYIVVSDLVCLGTEVKIVKNLIQFIGGQYLGNVSIIKTETLAKSDIKRSEATIAIFSINRDNNKDLSYNITTNLEPI